MNLYSKPDCELVAAMWLHAYWQFIRFSYKPHGELCMLSNPHMHFGRHRYIIDTTVLHF